MADKAAVLGQSRLSFFTFVVVSSPFVVASRSYSGFDSAAIGDERATLWALEDDLTE